MILVVGSTGSLGMQVTKGLAANGKQVIGMVRDQNADKAKALAAAGARLVVGDLKDRNSLDAAVSGIDAIVCTASSTMSRREGDSIETVDQKGVQTLIGAAEAVKVKRFVFVSFSRNIADDFPLAQSKRAAERRLEASKIDYTIFLPSYFAETWFSPAVGFDISSGTVRIYGDGAAKVSYVALADVGQAVVNSIDNPGVSRQAIPIGGPRAISQLEAMALAEKAAKKKIAVEHMTIDQIRAARKGAKDSMTASFLGLFESLARGDEIPTSWTDKLNVKPITMEAWLNNAYR
jgi:uncharacterized protein YbjT (DUF2867 family)